MKYLMKRAFVLLLSASILLSSIPAQNVYAEEDEIDTIEENQVEEQSTDETSNENTRAVTNWYYNDNGDGTIELTKYNGESGEDVELIIPDTIDGKTVKKWSYEIFKDMSFASVTMPTTLIQDGYSSLFGNCGAIKKVIVPSSFNTSPPSKFRYSERIMSPQFSSATETFSNILIILL